MSSCIDPETKPVADGDPGIELFEQLRSCILDAKNWFRRRRRDRHSLHDVCLVGHRGDLESIGPRHFDVW
ncbi:MAG: hypothetical protein ACREA0_05165, partial [bacterium]